MVLSKSGIVQTLYPWLAADWEASQNKNRNKTKQKTKHQKNPKNLKKHPKKPPKTLRPPAGGREAGGKVAPEMFIPAWSAKFA